MILNKGLKKIGNYQLIQIIGKGANGIVFKGLNNETGRSVAIKQVALSQQQLKSVQSQIQLLRKLSHEHIVKYIDVLQSQGCLHIVLQFIQGGSLANLVKKYPLPENLVKVYIKQVLAGLDYLHQMAVVHRDIKGANILLTKEGIVKLADFGVAIRLNEDHKSFSLAGTPYWMAPEIIQSKGEISTSCDIWSLGCTVIQLLTGNPPYFDLMQYPALFRIVQDDHPPLPQVSEQCKNFLLRCFKKQPEMRDTASQLMKHHWLQQVMETEDSTLEVNFSFPIKDLIKDRNYSELITSINKIPTKRLIYHNPFFVEIVYDKQNQARSLFVIEMIKDDWQTFKYLASIGLIQSVINTAPAKNSKLTNNICEIIYIASSLCGKYLDLSIFMVNCLKPLRRLLNLGVQKDNLLIAAIQNIISQQILVNSHMIYILCKEMLLNNIIAYFHKALKIDQAEAHKAITLIHRISSIRQSHIAIFFSQSIKFLLKYLETLEDSQCLGKLIKTFYNLSRDEHMANQLEFQGIIPYSLRLFEKLLRMDLKDENILLYYDIIKTLDVLTNQENRKEQFLLNKGKTIITNHPLNGRKDFVDIINALCRKVGDIA